MSLEYKFLIRKAIIKQLVDNNTIIPLGAKL